ncbi:ABC transporter [Deinococcus metalli]|uniref:ABC transporter n=1 Tax=Deinococcus metalli TaxID=1141878 RepID=A0ABQ3JP90_9DEIO|nr:ABC transporter [Deinococcus metalli]
MALLDDVAAIARLAAASVDDIGAAAGRASMKAVGVVVDDTAVTPRYVTGFSPDRELPIIWRIARGSLRNKVVFILPAALLLSQFLPWAITPILMLGGAYLCFEGAEKVYEAVSGGAHHDEAPQDAATLSSAQHEGQMVSGAIRTDFILSAEIMALSLSEVADEPLLSRTLILVVVAVLITALVYGVVGLIVKMDDLGLKLARSGTGAARALGRGLVRGMPAVLAALSVIGTAAMLWVGGHILLVGLEEFGVAGPYHALHDAAVAAGHAIPALEGVVEWLVETLGSAVVGLIVGGIIVALLHLRPGRKAAH